MGFVRRHGAALLAYAVATLILTWPLAAQLTSRLPADNGDPLLSVWTLWWNARHLPFTERWWHGDIFTPAPDALSYSDHRVGLGLIASPLLWSGASPLAAYNVAFLASYILSGVSMYALALGVTQRRAAAFIAGLAFALHPFRAEHLPHLEVLSAYWLPLVLLALHRWVDTAGTRPRWLLAAAGFLTLQALSCGYYFVFASVLVATWVAWFVTCELPVRRYVELGAALVAPVVVMAPVFWHYRQAHVSLGLSRSITEIEQLSADIAAFVTAPTGLWAWHWLRAWPALEGSLFPGLTTLLVVAAAGVTQLRGSGTPGVAHSAWPHWRRMSAALAVAVGAVASLPGLGWPIDVMVGSVRISVQTAYKPLSIAALLAGVVLLGSPMLRRAWHRRSPGVYYAGVTVLLWAFALGPTARMFGARAFYKAPYAWLMAVPGFAEEIRAPARFAMLAALTLSMAAAVAIARLAADWSDWWRRVALVAVSAAVVADGWVHPFPLVSPPPPLVLPPELPSRALVLELPLGVWQDAAAMYRATIHGHAVANGMSGYDPPHMTVLRAALADGYYESLDVLAPGAPLAVSLDDAALDGWRASLAARSAVPWPGTSTPALFLRPPSQLSPDWPSPALDRHATIAAVSTNANETDVDAVIDGRLDTVWVTPRAQQGDEWVIATLTDETEVTGLRLSLGRHAAAFPRHLILSVSLDGQHWQDVHHDALARQTMITVQADPRLVRVPVAFPATRARMIRLRQTARSSVSPWAIDELVVLRTASPQK
jgi:F5/8 type C domain